MLLILAGGGHLQAGQGVGDLAVFHQQFEPDLGVLFLVVGGFGKDRSQLLIALFLCLGCEEGVLVAGLAFTSESLPQVFLCLAASQFHSIASVYNIF